MIVKIISADSGAESPDSLTEIQHTGTEIAQSNLENASERETDGESDDRRLKS